MKNPKNRVKNTRKSVRRQRGDNKNIRPLIVNTSNPHLLNNPGLMQACCEAVSAYNIARAR